MAFSKKNYKFTVGKYKNKPVIWVHFPFNSILKMELKAMFPYAGWSYFERCWYLPDNAQVRKLLDMEERVYEGKRVVQSIHPVNRPAFFRLIDQLKLKGYSLNTIKTYAIEFAQLLSFLKNQHVNLITPEFLRTYLLHCINNLLASENLIHSRLNAIKFYFEQVLLKENFFIDIPRPKKALSLPKVLNKDEITRLFDVIENHKHVIILKLCYGMGLRVSEIVNLKISDIDSKRMLVLIASSKGKKDRYVPLPKKILPDLRAYYLEYRPKKYLFEGQYGGQYAVRSVQAIFKNAMKKARINKNIGIHGLRHSYATHLLEYGTDMYLIQRLLGHNDIKTTEIYAKVSSKQISNIKSPLDEL